MRFGLLQHPIAGQKSFQSIIIKSFSKMSPATRSRFVHTEYTTGATDAVWIHKDPYSNRPAFTPLTTDTKTGVCIIGSGIAGTSVAYELVTRGHNVMMIEARGAVAGETGRTSGHLSNSLDDGYDQIAKKHGREGAKAAAESHTWALNRVGEVAKRLGIACEYRHVPAYNISQYEHGSSHRDKDIKDIQQEADLARELGLDASVSDDLTIRGWDGKVDQRGGSIYSGQAAFHPTQYVAGVLNWLRDQPNFRCHTDTRMMSISEDGAKVEVQTEAGHTIQCAQAVEATCVPLQKLSVVVEMGYYRTYSIAIRVPKSSVEDCFVYDSNDPYKYMRLTAGDDKDDYMIVGGGDHKVGQEGPEGRFEELEKWVRDRFTTAGTVDYRWSGQIYEPFDYVGFIGKNQGHDRLFIVTGDSGNGLTHGVLAGRLIADEIEGNRETEGWAELYSPKRIASILKSTPSMLASELEVNVQYKRLLTSDITDIEDLVPGSGGVLSEGLGKKVAVYKGEDGSVKKMNALCPHMKGVVRWNPAEKSFDCPVHGSRFSVEGVCLIGPAKANLQSAD